MSVHVNVKVRNRRWVLIGIACLSVASFVVPAAKVVEWANALLNMLHVEYQLDNGEWKEIPHGIKVELV